jgi:diacylglycerol kinase family enzyme
MLAPHASLVLPRVDVIANRLARHLAADRRRESRVLREVRRAVERAKGRAWLHETASLEDLESAVATIRARGTDCVVLAGGDGSYMAGTSALSRAFGDALPAVAFAPGGTVCTVARNWGLRASRVAYTRALLDQVLRGVATVTPRPTLRARDDRGGDRAGFIFGAGLVARFFDAYYESRTPGSLAAAALVARIFAGTFTRGELAERVLTPGPARILVDGHEQAPKAWSLIAASVVKDLGLHMHLLHRAGESETAFHFVASPLPPRRLSPQVGRVVLGKRLRGEGHVDQLAREVTIELGDASSTYVLDGDRIPARSVTLTPGPVLRYTSPARSR